MQYRRFGRTGIQIPVISCGGMRYQQSWKGSDEVTDESQKNLEACIERALELGVNHIETARAYGTSEVQLGKVLPKFPREDLLVQTKVGPMADVEKFKATFEKSIRLLNMDYLDIFSFHGVNNAQSLENAKACMDTVQKWKQEGRIRSIGFSTHGSCESIVNAIETDLFDHINIHYYYIFQENLPALEAAARHDMGVFIISPNDKGGMLYKPSEKLVSLCEPLHPMVFNGLFCLSHPQIHTLSCGAARPSDFDIHMEMVSLLGNAEEVIQPIVKRLEAEMENTFGAIWAESWLEGLPDWDTTPGELNMRWILRLRNLAVAYDMLEYAKTRYNMLGNGGPWVPGNTAGEVDKIDLSECLASSPNAEAVPKALAEAHELLVGKPGKRLADQD